MQGFRSLERRLPLLIGGLVAVSLIATLALAFLELRQSALAESSERLERVNTQVRTLLSATTERNLQRYREAAARPEVRAYLAGFGDNRDSALAIISRLPAAADSLTPKVLRTNDGRVLLQHPGDGASPLLAERAAPAAAPRAPHRITYGQIHNVGATPMFWITIPVTEGEAVLGYIDLLRPLRVPPATAADMRRFMGEGVQLFLTNRAGGPWATIDGEVLTDAPQLAIGKPMHEVPLRGGLYAHADTLDGTDLVLVTAMPVARAVSRPLTLLRRLVVFGIVLLGLGGLGAWLVSRSVTRPLRRLGDLADAIATGDYSGRSDLERPDEIGRLASSFDAMLEHIEASHGELARRVEHAQALAVQLESANQRLHLAIRDADAARIEALAANRAKSEFLATMSHEIRTPINAMIGYTDLLEAGVAGALGAKQEEFVGRIRVSGMHLISIVNDVLDFAKMESGQLRLQREVQPTTAAIHAAVAMFEARARARCVDVAVRCVPDSTYFGDSGRVQQILLNLLSNAIKFTDAGGRVTIGCEERESRSFPPTEDSDPARWTCIAVADTGIGIAADQLNSIFEPFVQGTSGYTRPHGGTGLGLAISRSLARMMNGDLTVESEVGHGATFTLWLPHPSTAAVPQPV